MDLSAYAGIAATGILTINYLFGMLIGISYQRIPFYARIPAGFKRISIYNWHNITAYIALSFVLLHPTLLLFDHATKFSFVDLIFPVNAPTQKLYVDFGTISMFAIVIVILTTQKAVKKRLTFRTWKNIHLISYVTGLLFIVHGIVMDPQLKNRPVDLLDAEKIASELCFLVLLAATFFRVRYEIRRRRSSTFYKLRIAEVINETADAKTFVLDISRNRKKLFGYIPQFTDTLIDRIAVMSQQAAEHEKSLSKLGFDIISKRNPEIEREIVRLQDELLQNITSVNTLREQKKQVDSSLKVLMTEYITGAA